MKQIRNELTLQELIYLVKDMVECEFGFKPKRALSKVLRDKAKIRLDKNATLCFIERSLKPFFSCDKIKVVKHGEGYKLVSDVNFLKNYIDLLG